MPAVGETGRRVVVRRPKKKPQPKPVIRNADTGDRARGRPEPAPLKVRQYAHPQRKGPRKAMRAVAREENTKETQRQQRYAGEKFAKDRLRREVSRIKVTPVPSPDARDTLRSPAQKARDRAAVASSVRSSRVKAVQKKQKGSGTRALKDFLDNPIQAQLAGRPKKVSPAEAKRLRAKGVKVGTLSPSQAKDTGAFLPPSISAGTVGITRAARATAIGVAQDPKKSIPATAKGFRDMGLGIPGAVVKSGVETYEGAKAGDPLRAVKTAGRETAADYKKRYGDLNKPGGAAKFSKRVSKEGAAPELVDAAILATGTAGAAGRGLSVVAKTGRLGAKAEKIATVRPDLRVSGGAAKKQTPHRNLVVAAGQAAVDTKRKKAHAKRKAKAERKGHARPATDVETKPGEVTPLRIRVPGRKAKADRLAVGDVAERAGHVNIALKSEQGRELNRESSRNIAGLSKLERVALTYAVKFGIRDPDRAVEVLTAHRARVVAEREKAGTKIPRVRRRTNDNLIAIDKLLAKPEAFTSRVARVADEETSRGKRVAAGDPGLGTAQAALRRSAQQAEHLGVERGTRVVEAFDEAATMSAVERRIRRAQRADTAKVRRAERRADKRRKGVVDLGNRTLDPADMDEWNDLEYTRKELTKDLDGGKLNERQERESRAALGDILDRQTELQGGLNLPGGARRAQARQGRSEAAGARQAMREGEEARLLGRVTSSKPTERAESASQYLNRVRAARQEAGLAEPGYFKSNKRPTATFSDRAKGGTRAIQEDKTYTGALHRTGTEDIRPEAGLTQAFARNIKRKHNWNLVADHVKAHQFEWARGKSVQRILDLLDDKGIDPGSVVLWNPRLFRQEAAKAPEGERTGGEEIVSEGLDAGVDTSAVTLKKNSAGEWVPAGLSTSRDEFKQSGWTVIPKAVYDEIHSETRPSGPWARGWDIAKTKQARLLLGTSPAWLQFQVASNAALTGLAGVGPRDLVRAQLWWKTLSQAERDAIEPYIGVGHFRDTAAQPKMGAAMGNGLANAYRGFKENPFFHTPRKALRGGNVTDLNPLDALFRVDAAQNNAFRKAILYNRVKRDAYQRIGRDVGQMQRIQDGVMNSFTLGPKEQMRAVIRDKDALEQHAGHVNDFLGNYTKFTAFERRKLQRNIMFYGYLKFSLRFTLLTMPTKHPVVTGILAQLGRMQTEEVKGLLGGEALPYQLGKFYFAKDGKLKSVNVARANPTMNAVFDLLSELPDPKKAIAVLPPLVQSAINQMAKRNVALGQDFRVQGKEDTSAWEGKAGTQAADRGRILANDMLSLMAPYREWAKASTKGVPLGDDSLVGSPRPTRFKDRDVQLGVQRQAARDKRSTARRYGESFAPFIPQPDKAREQVALAAERKKLRAITKQIDETPQSKRTTPETSWKGGGIYTVDFQRKLDTQKALRARVNRLQAMGEPAPPAPRLERRPLSPREEFKRDIEKLKSENPREEFRKDIQKIKARQRALRGG